MLLDADVTDSIAAPLSLSLEDYIYFRLKVRPSIKAYQVTNLLCTTKANCEENHLNEQHGPELTPFEYSFIELISRPLVSFHGRFQYLVVLMLKKVLVHGRGPGS